MNIKTTAVAFAFLALPLVGCAATPTQAAVPAPTVTATSTPQACLDALDMADEGFDISASVIGVAADTMQLMPDVVDAVLAYDADAIDAVTAKVKRYTAKIEGYTEEMSDLSPRYSAAKAECRGDA